MSPAAGSVADATGNWVDTLAPAWSRPYLRLARLDRPIGSWLLLLPCWWSSALAASPLTGDAEPRASRAVLRRRVRHARRRLHLERHRRSRSRRQRRADALAADPVRTGERPSGLRLPGAAGADRSGGADLVQPFTIALGIASLAIVAIYPFMKRITYWPQIVLGLAFSWGALMGWAAAFGRLDAPAFLLYAGSIAWVIGYDTIYAHQDREDDALIGIKSTALLFGERTKPMLTLFYALAVILIGVAGFLAGAGAGVRDRPARLCRASGLADRPARHRRSRSLSGVVQVRPRRGPDPVCRIVARRAGAPLCLAAEAERTPLLRRQAAIHGERLPDDERRIVGGEEQHRTPDLFGLRYPADRMP